VSNGRRYGFMDFMLIKLLEQFRYHVDEVIFHYRIVDEVIIGNEFCKSVTPRKWTWDSYVQTYIARRSMVDSDHTLLGVQIRLLAERIYDLTNETRPDQLFSYVQTLVGFAFLATPAYVWFLVKNIPQKKLSEIQFKSDLIDAVVKLNFAYLARRLLAERTRSDVLRPRNRACGFTILEDRLCVAAYNGSKEMIWLLLEMELTISNSPPYLSPTLLLYAARGGHRNIFDFILDYCHTYQTFHGPNNSPFSWTTGYAMLCNAIAETIYPEDYERGVGMLPDDYGIFSVQRHGDLTSRLTYSARTGNINMARYFLEHGARPNNPNTRRSSINGILDPFVSHRSKPLLSALKSGDIAIVKLMLEYGAEPNWFASDETALMVAAYAGNMPMVRLLMDHGADVNDGNPAPIVLAVRGEHMEMFRYLRSKGAVLDTPETGVWAMAVAIRHGLDSMISLLVAEGVVGVKLS
jgi:ankyrin repeat protein